MSGILYVTGTPIGNLYAETFKSLWHKKADGQLF